RAPQPAQPGLWVAIDARVVPRGHRAGAEYLRALEQVLELEALIARHARDWRASREIGARELIDHLALEALAVVRDVEAHAEPVGDEARVVGVLERAAARARPGEVHRHANRLVPALDHERGGHRRVHAAR